MFCRISAAVFAAFFSVASGASAATLDFDTGLATYSGANNLTMYSQAGLTFSIAFTSNGDSVGANLFDTLCPPTSNCSSAGDDQDLVPPFQGQNGVAGNVLILQEVGASLADDSRLGGTITFTLIGGPAFSLLGFSAVDDGTFSMSTIAGTLGSLSPGGDNVTASTTFASPSPLIGISQSFTVTYSGSGGVDSIEISTVPLPPAAAMLLLGLGGLAAVRRRNKAPAATA